jgi:hypothetical protein
MKTQPMQCAVGATAQPFVLQPGFTENPQPPSADFFRSALSSVMDDKGQTHKTFKFILRAEKVRALRKLAAQKLASVRREDSEACHQRAKEQQATLRALFDAKKHRQSFYRF